VDNHLDGGCGGGTTSRAVYLVDSSLTACTGNYVVSGTGGLAYGLYAVGTSVATIAGNTFHAHNDTLGGGTLNGLYLGAPGLRVINNVINVNALLSGQRALGIILAADDLVILNNTVAVAHVESGTTVGLQVDSMIGGALIENNILFSGGSVDPSYGLWFDGSLASFASNNLDVDLPAWIGADVPDLDTTLVTTDAGTGTLASFGNVSIRMIDDSGVDHLVSPAGLDGDLTTTLDNDWRLTSDASDLELREGGRDQSAVDGFPTEGNGYPIDRAGVVRTAGATAAINPGAAGWSLGAYERD
jgi:hypothetical protein